MSEWIKPTKKPPISEEVEIAFWDGCYVVRMFGAYTEDGWYSGEYELPIKRKHHTGESMIGWQKARPLPEPPKD